MMRKVFLAVCIVFLVLSVTYILVSVFWKESVNTAQKVLSVFTKRKHKNVLFDVPPFPIDVVYTWAGENQGNTMRLAYHGEIKYSLRGVLEFMPWVNRVFIVMNEKKKPSWFGDDYQKYVTLVGHDEIFKDGINAKLPTTNSNAIETALVNIPGLSEHFIYFNDDFFVSRMLHYSRFFNDSGQAVIQPLHVVNLKRTTFDGAVPQLTSGFHHHTPLPLRKSSFQKFNKLYAKWVGWVRGIDTRRGLGCDVCKEFAFPCPCQQIHGALSKFMEKEGNAIQGPEYPDNLAGSNISYFNHYNGDILETIKANKLADTFTINDTAETPSERAAYGKKITAFLQRMYPKPCIVELNLNSGPVPSESVIPKIIHQTWKTQDVPEKYRTWVRSWKEKNPDFTYKLYDNDESRLLVASSYPEFLELYDSLPTGVQKADLFRYLVIHKFGGVYADLDTECQVPIADVLKGHQIILGKESNQVRFQALQWFFAATPRHPAFLEIAEEIKKRMSNPAMVEKDERYAISKDKLNAKVLYQTGPWVFTDVMKKYIDSGEARIHQECVFGCSTPNAQAPGVTQYVRHYFEGTWKTK